MEENTEQIQMNENYIKQPLSNGTTALVLGILSITLFCCCWGILSLILGIIGVVLGSKAVGIYHENVDMYSEASYKNANAGKICSIIGLVLASICFAFVILQWAFYGTTFLYYLEMLKSIIEDSL